MTASATVFLLATLTLGQTSQPADHLRDFEDFIGTWSYEGELKENVKGDSLDFDKDTKVVARLSWKRILDGAAVQYEWEWGPAGGRKTRGTSLIHWDPKEEKIVSHTLNSLGASFHGVMTFDKSTRTWTCAQQGVRPSGQEQSSVNVWALAKPGALVLQAKNRKGTINSGDSPSYTFKKPPEK